MASATRHGLLRSDATPRDSRVLVVFLQIKKAGCTVLLVQKSILRDAYNDLSIHFLAKVSMSLGFGAPQPGFSAFLESRSLVNFCYSSHRRHDYTIRAHVSGCNVV